MSRQAIHRSPVAALLAAAGLSLGASLMPAPSQAQAQAPTPAMAAAQQRMSLTEVLAALRQLPKQAEETESLKRASAALTLTASMDLGRASKAINEALQLDASNSYLHFFNGFIYHLLARQGDSEKTDMAIEGYAQAARMEPGNWIAREFMGLALLEKKQYKRAQAAFAEVLITRPDDTVVLSRMLAASYMAGDARTACGVADQLAKSAEGNSASFLRAAVSVYGACGHFDKAESARVAYAAQAQDPADVQQLTRRLAQWQSFYRLKKGKGVAPIGAGPKAPEAPALAAAPTAHGPVRAVKTAFLDSNGKPLSKGSAGSKGDAEAEGGDEEEEEDEEDGDGGSSGSSGSSGSRVPKSAPSSGSTRMVLVDVVMVRTEDSIATAKGVNLLSALTLQFGSVSAPAFSKSFESTTGAGGSTILTRSITVPALAYSLNLANANSNLNEVLARPTLAAVEGLRSEFFSGTSLNAAVVAGGTVSGGSAVSLEKRYGVKLTVLPQILPNGMIKLAIDASRTFLKPPSANIGFTYRLEISEIQANANVVMRMGDTLVLGGLSEKESTSSRDGVPGLQEVPGVQYLFSQQAKTEYQRSVLILITPRPATYTWLSDEARAAMEAESTEGVGPDVLRARFGDWFKPYPNLASVFHHLNYADLYREFRTGDVTLERWDRMTTTSERLRQALSFLYY